MMVSVASERNTSVSLESETPSATVLLTSALPLLTPSFSYLGVELIKRDRGRSSQATKSLEEPVLTG